MKEEWRDIAGYEGLYQVSNFGRVKSLNYNHTIGKERILKPSITKRGYLMVVLFKNKKGKTFLIHRLVAQAFIPNPNNYPCVNHKSEIKTQNNVENLEWCDNKYNLNYGTRVERIFKKTTNGKCSKPVLQIDPTTDEVIAEFPSIHQVQRELGYKIAHISACCKGRRKTCGNFKCQFKPTT